METPSTILERLTKVRKEIQSISIAMESTFIKHEKDDTLNRFELLMKIINKEYEIITLSINKDGLDTCEEWLYRIDQKKAQINTAPFAHFTTLSP